MLQAPPLLLLLLVLRLSSRLFTYFVVRWSDRYFQVCLSRWNIFPRCRFFRRFYNVYVYLAIFTLSLQGVGGHVKI